MISASDRSLSADGLEQHRNGDGVDQPRRDRDVAVPQLLEMQIDLRSVHADVGDGAARRDDVLAQLERRRDADRLDRGIDAALAGHLHDRLGGLAVGAVDGRRGAEALGDFEPIVVEIDHDDLGGGVELRGEQGREADRPGADDGDGAARLRPCR